jgi:hypothetical protein
VIVGEVVSPSHLRPALAVTVGRQAAVSAHARPAIALRGPARPGVGLGAAACGNLPGHESTLAERTEVTGPDPPGTTASEPNELIRERPISQRLY